MLRRKFKKAIVTGGAGFIGSHLTKYLVSKGINVIVIDDFSTGSIKNLSNIQNKVKIVKANILDNSIKKHFYDSDVVFHCAALVGVKIVTAEPVKVMDQNINGVRNILDLCKKHKLLHVFISSSEVYGNSTDMPVDENSIVSPISPYGLSKIVGETYCHSFKRKYGTNSIILRLFNVYGPGQDPTGYSWVVPSFILRITKKQPLIIHGSGNQTRDFTFVSDTVKGIYLAAIKGEYNEVYNIGTGMETSIKDLAFLVLKKMGRSSNLAHFSRDRKFQIERRCAGISKATNDLGFKSQVKLSDGIDETITYFTKNKII